MSSDNGIYIGVFPTHDGLKEYRVIHAQAIDNCDYSGVVPDSITDLYIVAYFGDARTFPNQSKAWTHARKLAEEYTVLEYGVSEIKFDRPLIAISQDEASKLLEEYWKHRDSKRISERIDALLSKDNGQREQIHKKVADLIAAGYKQTSRRYRMLARIPPGKTGLEALAEFDSHLAEHFLENANRAAASQYMSCYAKGDDKLELTEEEFNEFLRQKRKIEHGQ
jgi:hypothetical protein